MSTMMFVSKIGAPEGALVTAYREAGEKVFVYDINSREVLSDATSIQQPTWADPEFGRGYLRKSYFDSLLADLKVTRILATGLTAAAFALEVIPELEIVPILQRGDLNFSVRRPALVENFRIVNSKAKKIFVEDTFEMDKAVGHGAQVPLLRMPTHVVGKQRILGRGLKKVGLLYSNSTEPNKLEKQLSLFEEKISEHGFEVKRVNIDTMFSLNDMRMGRGFPGTMRYRIGDCSHIVILGDSRNTTSVLSGLSNESQFVFVEDTINSNLMYSRGEYRNYGRGYSLLTRLIGSLSDTSNDNYIKFAPDLASKEIPDYLENKMNQEHDPDYEEFLFDSKSLSFDVFFSVAPIENRTNGARPQRIRNMALAMQHSTNCLRLSPHPNMIDRRTRLIKSLISDGYTPRFVYGENSTSPMASFDTIMNVTRLFSLLKSNGAHLGWFVRDLHWLSKDATGIRENQLELQTMINRGLFELKELSNVVDQFYAPHSSSVRAFKELLVSTSLDIDWKVLSPGVAWTNEITSVNTTEENSGLTLTYSGGIQGIYKMDNFIDAAAPLCRAGSVYLDLVIRREDLDAVATLLANVGLESSDMVRVLLDDFEDYEPRTQKVVGVIILDTDYAKAAFPYKTVSMLEKGMPILTCDDMAISSFVTQEEIGLSVNRDSESIRDGILQFRDFGWDRFKIGQARSRYAWEEKVEFVRSSLNARV